VDFARLLVLAASTVGVVLGLTALLNARDRRRAS
jgi:hypothetical protein